MAAQDTFKTLRKLTLEDRTGVYYSLPKLAERTGRDLTRLPVSIRILLENLLRHEDGRRVTRRHIEALMNWTPEAPGEMEFPFFPARVLMQDFTGVPAVADLAAMRDELARLGGDPDKINPHLPVHLVVDHSVQVDRFGTGTALAENVALEMERNRERYSFLKWGQTNLDNFQVVPPATGICHQVNLEYLAPVVQCDEIADGWLVYPDTLIGLDSHTTMINSLGVLGWGVGGIEAEAVMLGQPVHMLPPRVIGVEVTGALPEGTTATDLVLQITQIMREKGVVGSFLEFFGEGLAHLRLADRATIANMTPEFGATTTFFPVDRQTLDYLALTSRSPQQIGLVAEYLRAQELDRTVDRPPPAFSDCLQLDLGMVEPSVAGPRRPQDRLRLRDLPAAFRDNFQAVFGTEKCYPRCDVHWEEEGGALPQADRLRAMQVQRKPFDARGVPVHRPYLSFSLDHGAVVLAAITSCTNTSNPSVLLGAGIMARKAVERGLMVRPWVKTSLAPGSTVVTEYLRAAGLLPYLEALRFHPVAYGCTTCIGNSGSLHADVAGVVKEAGLVVASVLSGNRNYEGRINALTRANYLASPLLVIAFALAGTVNIDLENEPLGHDPNNQPVYLRDIWPARDEIEKMQARITPDLFSERYGHIYDGDQNWQQLSEIRQQRYPWQKDSTYVKEPPFFRKMSVDVPVMSDIRDARVLALLGDSITTDHISPAGAIPADSPAGRYLREQGREPADFNSFGARRGNHEVMIRGTFGNVRLKNLLAPDTEGGWTTHLPSGEVMTVYDAAQVYQEAGTPLIILAGRDYGAGSSRDWAAKGTLLLGVRAVLAESFERIHRSNLVAMGVLPLQFREGQTAVNLGLTGREVFSISGIGSGLSPGRNLEVRAEPENGAPVLFTVTARIDSPVEVEYYHHGGILPYVLRQILKGEPDMA